MGQKVNPHGFRVGVIKDWDSRWYAEGKEVPELIKEDFEIRKFIKNKMYIAGITRMYIDRATSKQVSVNIFAAKPGIIVGKGGASIKALKSDLEKLTGRTVKVDISEVKNVSTDAQLVAEEIASSIERRVSFRRAMKKSMGRAMRFGAKGFKVMVSGRLNGAEMARVEQYTEGNVPLSTLRANIDYGFAEANTTYGIIGVKVWVNKGEVLAQPGEGKKLIRKDYENK
ncbi:30S ribosomal protein S3 [Clostridiaceae bacterium HSG29]|nr:30S ribosomal protein S3 [Clostridiaceae bacterium HSG29]